MFKHWIHWKCEDSILWGSILSETKWVGSKSLRLCKTSRTWTHNTWGKGNFLAQAKVNVPIEEPLCKHNDVFRKDKQDLGKGNSSEHKIDLEEDSPVFVNQFPMPEVHRDIPEG
jgi:hypothetical protein